MFRWNVQYRSGFLQIRITLFCESEWLESNKSVHSVQVNRSSSDRMQYHQHNMLRMWRLPLWQFKFRSCWFGDWRLWECRKWCMRKAWDLRGTVGRRWDFWFWVIMLLVRFDGGFCRFRSCSVEVGWQLRVWDWCFLSSVRGLQWWVIYSF